MQVVLLLILVIAVATFFGKKNSQYSRIVVGSVFGVFVFFFWQDLQYYADLKHWPDLHKKIAFLFIGIFAIVLSKLLINLKRELLVSSACFTAFIIIGVVHYSEDADIKNTIALYSGFFDSPINKPNTGYEKDETTTTFQYPLGGYQMAIPANWTMRTDKGPLFPYFQLMAHDKVSIEFRPGCFNKQSAIFTELVANLGKDKSKSNIQFDSQCINHGNSFYSCKITQFTPNKKATRVFWIATRNDISKGIELDFVIHKSEAEIRREIDGVINSIKPATSQTYKDRSCLKPVEWF